MFTRTLLIFAIVIINNLNLSALESMDSIKPKIISCDTIEVKLKNGYVMYWKVDEMDIIIPWEESRFSAINKGKKITRASMYQQIADTTSLNIYVPYKTSGSLRVGDLVCMLFMHKLEIPFAKIFGTSFHWFNPDSPIPEDLLDWIESDRENSVKQIMRYCKDPDKYYTDFRESNLNK